MRTPELVVLLISLIGAGCSESRDASAVNASGRSAARTGVAADNSAVSVKRYTLHGQVVRIDSAHSSVTIRHDKIEDWMDAMTMSFPVKDEAAFRALHAGDRITATLYVRDQTFWISEVHSDF